MSLLAQKLLKMELRLKSYGVLNFKGLNCKISILEIDFLLNQGLNHKYGKA
jgi:hypothetical protein